MHDVADLSLDVRQMAIVIWKAPQQRMVKREGSIGFN
jgi:hypothetical protein